MNSQNPFFSALIIIGGVLGGLMVTLSVLLSHGNTLAQLCFYLLVGGIVAGLLAPRTTFYVWIVACAYSDLLKRLTIVFGEVSLRELTYILGITPVMFSAITASIVVGGLTGTYQVKTFHWKLLALGVLITCGVGGVFLAQSANSPQAAMQGIANGGLYSLLLFVMPVLFPTLADTLKVLRFTVWIFLPVAIYGILQQIYGFQPFEIAYLRTGLSIEIKQLFTQHVRAFSTLNSPTALGSVSGLLAVLSWFLSRQPRPAPHQHKRWIGKIAGCLLVACYVGSLIASTGRTCIAIIPISILAAWSFRSPVRTAGLYGTITVAFVSLVAVSPWLLNHLQEAIDWSSSQEYRSEFAQQFAVVGTYYDRLHGFAHVLGNPAAYTPFGRWDGRYENLPTNLLHHDFLSLILLRFGFVPLIIGGAMAIRLMSSLHRKNFSLKDTGMAAFMSLSMAQFLTIIVISLIGGNILAVFPVNVFLWMFAATAFMCTQPPPKPAPPSPAGSTGLDIESLAGRTPGAKRFSPKRAAT